MPKKYTQEQFWELYEKLPQELKDALFAEETGNNIYDICKKNGAEKNLEAIVDSVGQVLVGVLAPEDFQENLEKEMGFKKETAKKIAQEINRFIFYPVKPALEQLFKIEITSSEKPTETTTESAQKPETPPDKDTYREPVE